MRAHGRPPVSGAPGGSPDERIGVNLGGVTSRPEPRSPANLTGSKWTCREPEHGLRHWIVIERSRDEVVLQSVLSPATTRRVAWRSLRERARWEPGWR